MALQLSFVTRIVPVAFCSAERYIRNMETTTNSLSCPFGHKHSSADSVAKCAAKNAGRAPRPAVVLPAAPATERWAPHCGMLGSTRAEAIVASGATYARRGDLSALGFRRNGSTWSRTFGGITNTQGFEARMSALRNDGVDFDLVAVAP